MNQIDIYLESLQEGEKWDKTKAFLKKHKNKFLAGAGIAAGAGAAYAGKKYGEKRGAEAAKAKAKADEQQKIATRKKLALQKLKIADKKAADEEAAKKAKMTATQKVAASIKRKNELKDAKLTPAERAEKEAGIKRLKNRRAKEKEKNVNIDAAKYAAGKTYKILATPARKLRASIGNAIKQRAKKKWNKKQDELKYSKYLPKEKSPFVQGLKGE